MYATLEKSKAIINGSLVISIYLIFWILLTVVMPIISLGMRFYSKEQRILKDLTEEPEA